MGPAPVGDPNAAREAAREVLSGSSYPDLGDKWYSPILRVIADPIGSLERLLDWFAYYLFTGASVSWVAWLLVIVAAAAISFMIWRLTRSTRTDETVRISFNPGLSAQSVAELEELAARHESAGEWNQALRVRYSALVARLGEQGVVRVRPGRTIGEYKAEVSENAPGLMSTFSDASALFEWIWYGDHPASEADVNAMKQMTSTLLAKA